MDSGDKIIKKKVIEQLVEGYEFATQLQLLLSKPFGDHRHHDPTRITCGSDSGSGSGSADELLAKILRSFDKTISALDSFEPVAVVPPASAAVEGSRNTSCDDSAAPGFYDGRCEDSGDSRKRLAPNKGKRGCYKRKRKSQTWTVESTTLEDGHAWRKYGQKEILNAKYPRSYFRCTHKYTLGCKATKQVQKLDEDSKMFQITYIGDHTCHSNEERSTKIEPSVIITDSDNTWGSCSNVQEKGTRQEDSTVTVAGTVKEEETNGDDDQDGPTGDLSLVWNDFMAFEESETMYCSRETSSRALDMEFMVMGTHGFPFGDDELSF